MLAAPASRHACCLWTCLWLHWLAAASGQLHTNHAVTLLLQVLLDDLKDAVRTFNRALTAAVALLDSRHAGMVALLDRQATELVKKIQVTHTHNTCAMCP